MTASFVAFFTFIAFAIAPLLLVFAIMVALPYVGRRILLRLIISVTFISVVVIPSVTLLDLFGVMPFPLDDVTPDWLVAAILIGGLPVIIGLIFKLVWQYGIRLEDTLTEAQLANQALRTSERELEEQVQELQKSRARIVAVQEGVRRDIASHLHGRVQGRLLVLKGSMQELLNERNDLPETDQAWAEVIEKMDQLIQEELGPLSRRLYPAILRRGLVPGLQSLGDQFESALTIMMELDERVVSEERADRNLIPDQARLAAYRIAEEALTNVVKHADATSVTSGLGTVSMQDYSEAVGGGCTITSIPGKGTEVGATLPLLEQDAQHPQRAGSLG